MFKLSSKKMQNENKLRNMGQAILWLVIFTTSVCVFVPFSPSMPKGGDIDESWGFAINQAVAQGLSFGKEIIFTYGPYASIFTTRYHPSTDFMMLSGSLYLALCYGACLVILMKGVQWGWVLTYCVALAEIAPARDALLFSLPLLVGLSIFKMQSLEEGMVLKNKLAPVYVALLFAPLGLLPLIKGSLLILCGAIVFLCFALLIANKNRLLAVACLCAPVVSMLFFWIASGQAATSLADYVMTMLPIVSGYTEGMNRDGTIREVILYLAVSTLILLAISNQTHLPRKSKPFIVCLYFVFLFITFKAGFVRPDNWHVLISGWSILIAVLLLQFVFYSKIIRMTVVFALFYWVLAVIHVEPNYSKIPADIVYGTMSTYASAWSGINDRLEQMNWPRDQFDATVSSVRKTAPFPILQGTTDIYSSGQSELISSGNTWWPRPILQSYSAYTTELAELNRKHLLGSLAPDNIFFRLETIDSRMPSIDDGASWPILLLNYRPTAMGNGYVLLKKMGTIVDISNASRPKSQHHTFGERVDLPHLNGPIFAEIEMNPTFLGRIEGFLFKPGQLQITLELENGMTKQYRIIAAMAKSKFLISPLIEDTKDFRALYDANGALYGNQVKSIVIARRPGRFNLWNAEYTIAFSQIAPAFPKDVATNNDLMELRATYQIRKPSY